MGLNSSNNSKTILRHLGERQRDISKKRSELIQVSGKEETTSSWVSKQEKSWTL